MHTAEGGAMCARCCCGGCAVMSNKARRRTNRGKPVLRGSLCRERSCCAAEPARRLPPLAGTSHWVRAQPAPQRCDTRVIQCNPHHFSLLVSLARRAALLRCPALCCAVLCSWLTFVLTPCPLLRRRRTPFPE